MTRRHGRCARGARLVAKVPHGRWRTLTFLAALRHDRITAPCVIDGPINGTSFRAYVEQFLVPTLSPGDVVVMDNLGSHKGQAVRRLIRTAGGKLFFLPRYSPDLNPIEQVFAKLKTLLRKTDPRSIEDTWRGIGNLLDRFTPQQCANLSRQRRLCFNLTGSCSSPPQAGCWCSRPERRPDRRLIVLGKTSRVTPSGSDLGYRIYVRRDVAMSQALGEDAGSGGGALKVGGLPVPGQQIGDLAGRVIGDAGEHVGEIGCGLTAVELGGLDQRVDRPAWRPPASLPANR